MTEGVAWAVITPVYEDIEAASRLFRELRAVLGAGIYVVAVDDGSVRQPVSPQAISAAGLRGVVLQLKRNAGHQRAIATGLAYAAENLPGTSCIVMDSDGEDMPATIPELIARLAPPDIDAAVARRKNRQETLRFKAFYLVYKSLFRLLTGRRISFGNFMALKPQAVRRLAVMQELGTHVAAALLTSKLRLAVCPLDRGPRYAGSSKMNFTALVLHGCRALMIFAEDVLVRIITACAAIAGLSIAGIAASVLLKATGLATPGWFSVALGILMLVLLQTGMLTMVTLILTGVVRGIGPIAPDYRPMIDRILPATAAPDSPA